MSGAFHTRLMQPAQEPLARALRSVRVSQPLVPVYSNVTGRRYPDARRITDLLVQQVAVPVRWEQTMHALYERRKGTPFPSTFEVGPGRQLGSILRNCNAQAWKSYHHVDVLDPDRDEDQEEEGRDGDAGPDSEETTQEPTGPGPLR